jgi:hypothetical protein
LVAPRPELSGGHCAARSPIQSGEPLLSKPHTWAMKQIRGLWAGKMRMHVYHGHATDVVASDKPAS